MFGASQLVSPRVTGDDSFTPGRYTGAVGVFDSTTGAALCSAPIDVRNRSTVTELRMDGVPLTDALLADLIGQACQGAVAQIGTLPPGSRIVPSVR